jgi:hypothetical protein
VNDFMKWFLKVLLSAMIWVFVLSVRWDGRTMFSYANEALVQNALVGALDEQAAELWHRFKGSVRQTFTEDASKEQTPGN